MDASLSRFGVQFVVACPVDVFCFCHNLFSFFFCFSHSQYVKYTGDSLISQWLIWESYSQCIVDNIVRVRTKSGAAAFLVRVRTISKLRLLIEAASINAGAKERPHAFRREACRWFSTRYQTRKRSRTWINRKPKTTAIARLYWYCFIIFFSLCNEHRCQSYRHKIR